MFVKGENKIKNADKFIVTVIFIVMFPLCFCLSACDFNGKEKSKCTVSENYFYEINGALNTDSDTLDCDMCVKYINKFEGKKDYIDFDLYPNAFSENSFYKPVSESNADYVYPDGISYGYIKIGSVSSNGKNLFYETTDFGSVLRVYFGRSIERGEAFMVDIVFSVKFPKAFHRLGVYNGSYSAGNFYPSICSEKEGEFVHGNYNETGDPFDTDYADYFVTLSIPENYLVAHSGILKEETVGAGRKILKIEGENIKDFAFAASDKYRKESRTTSFGTTVNYYYFNGDFKESVLDAAVKSYEFFSEIFCDTEKKKFDIAETYLFSGGMEYSEMIMLSSEIFKSEYIVERITVHETAHQWWYYLVGSNQKFSPWIDEGLAEFSVFYYFSINDKYKADIFFDEQKLNIALFENSESDLAVKPLEDIYYFKGEDGERAYSASVYASSFIFFFGLFSENGKDFLYTLKNLCCDFKYAPISDKEFLSYIKDLKNYGKLYDKLAV